MKNLFKQNKDYFDGVSLYGLHKRFPNLNDEEFKKILLERLDKCHNRNY